MTMISKALAMSCFLLCLISTTKAQNQRNWKAIRNNRNNDVQIFEPIPMFNNFRQVQPVGPHRKVYRSRDAASTCLSQCEEEGVGGSTACVRSRGPTRTRRRRAYSMFFHWDYADQRRWRRWIHPMKWENECGVGSSGPAQPGESPIAIDPFEAEPIDVGFGPNDDAYIQLSDDWNTIRPFLFVKNNGHAIQVDVCGNNVIDCKARARFGDWPCKMRGANCSNDDYVLAQLHFHFGEDGTKGSEHTVCGSPRPAEMHMVFLNTRWGDPEDPVPWDLDKPERSVRFLVLGTFIESNGDGPDNPFFQPIVDAVQFPEPRQDDAFRDRGVAHWANTSGPSQGAIDLINMLPANFSTQFYSYPGALTTPPCSQFVSWFVFENAVQWSEKQLNQLRSATTYYHFPHAVHHYYSVILFACVMLILGTLTKQFLERYAPTVPYTMVVMLWGFCLNFLASINNDGQLNPFQQSLRMWSNIDGHLAMYVFLPALIFGDVMKVNVHTFFQTFKQSCFLAGPAVLLSAYLTALVVHTVLPYDWNWPFCMAIGSILAATDPIAVLALMKNLGAPKALTMQMSGESLLNDGTSVILFSIFFDMSRRRRGQYANVFRLIRIMSRFLLFSPILGIIVGAVAVYWMVRVAGHRHSKAGSLVQLCVTLIAAYLGFFLSDNSKIGAASGILTTVAAGLVVAYRAWPVVISKEAMENVWGTLEHILNTLIFGLVGVQMSRGKLSHNVNWRELYWCFVVYLAVFAIRALIVLGSLPFINRLGPHKIRLKESSFVVLGGLRGAVSLSLAIFVKEKRSNTMRTWPDDDDHDAERTLFLVGGVAFLTLLINAPMSHPVLKRLNLIAAGDKSKQPLLDCVRERIVESAERAYEDACLRLDHDAVDVTKLMRNLANVKHATPAADARHRALALEGVVENSATTEQPTKLPLVEADKTQAKAAMPIPTVRHADVSVGFDVRHLELTLSKLEGAKTADESRLPALREMFLSIVNAHYWHMIDAGELPKTARATITLLRSIDIAKDSLADPLHDFDALTHLLEEMTVGSRNERCFNRVDAVTPGWFTLSSELFYKMSYERYEVTYYVLRAYGIAHGHAQRIFLETVFGSAQKEPTRAEEVLILLESARLVEHARNQLDYISPNLKSIVKSKIVAESVLEAQRETLHTMLNQGVLEEADYDAISRELDEDERGVILARKAQTRAIVKIAVFQEKILTAYNDVGANGQQDGEGQGSYEMNPVAADGDSTRLPLPGTPGSLANSKRNKSQNNLLSSIETVDNANAARHGTAREETKAGAPHEEHNVVG